MILHDYQAFCEWAIVDSLDVTTDFYKHCLTSRQILRSFLGLGTCVIFVGLGDNGVETLCRKSLPILRAICNTSRDQK